MGNLLIEPEKYMSKDKTYYIICQSGARSARTVDALTKQGFDVVNVSNGTLSKLVGGLRLSPGTYSQIRLIPVDNSIALTASAKSQSASYNNEVDYVDSTSVSHLLPLEILAPENGFSFVGELKVPLGGGGPLPIASGSSNLGSSNRASSGPTILNFALNFNAATDIALFQYTGV